MEWKTDKFENINIDAAIAWITAFLKAYDISRLDYIYLSNKSKRGYGVSGMCYYPSRKHKRKNYHITGLFSGNYPQDIVSKRKPIYKNEDGTWPETPENYYVLTIANRFLDGKLFEWKQVAENTKVYNENEAVVWLLGHELFHFLRRTRQVPGRNLEWQADRFGDKCLNEFRSLTSGQN